jgi:hypothetical protein
MAQDLTVNIKTTSDVPQAMDKAKSATVSFSKQVEDIQKKFSTAFKDIFLGFTAPMVIIQNAIQMISESIAKAKQDAKDGLELIAKGETAYASTDEKRMAAFFKAKKEREEEKRLVEAGKSEVAAEFIKTPEGKALAEKMAVERIGALSPGAQIDIETLRDSMRGDKQFQQAALDAFMKSEEGKSFIPAPNDKSSSTSFKGPEGFSNVVGVGANPVMESMRAQLEEQQKQTLLLQNLVDRNPFAPTDFTKNNK